ncbi:MAG: metal ABC transporter substrate-binding protein [Armatimonadota bacterium]
MKIQKTLKIAALALVALAAGGARPAAAKVDVVAANQDLAWVVRAVGGNQVSVDYLASSNQDPHLIDPRPSQVVKLARADMAVRIGMDLDLWFDSLIRASGNSKILPGKSGYVDASRGVKPLEVPQGKLDPSRGDLHVFGNPHYFFGPSNLIVVAENVKDGLQRVDPSNGSSYQSNFQSLMSRLNDAIKGWKAQLAADRGKKVVTYHRSLVYFLNNFDLVQAGNVEPRPGIEPTPGHVARMASEMKQGGVKVILTESFRPRRYSDLLARQSGGVVVAIPGGVGAEKGLDDYFKFMDAVVTRVAAAL